MNWYIEVLKKYVVFSGRAHRTEYWMFTLINFVIVLALMAIGAMIGIRGLSGIYNLAVLLPSIGVTVRRLHDTGKTGWLALVWLVPVIGWVAILIFMALEGQEGDNQYGPSPQAA